MKLFLTFITTLLLLTTSLSAQESLPNVDLKTVDGQKISLKESVKSGKITVLSFWATWCAPCKRELDEIKELYPLWQEDYNVDLIAISVDDARSVAKIRGMVEQKGWPYTVLSDVNQDLQKALNFQTVPMTFLIDQSGKIVWSHSGYNIGDEVELEEQIKSLAGK